MAESWIGEVVKEFVLRVDGLKFSVKRRIAKSTNPEGQDEFEWDISHYCKGSKGAGTAYIPGSRREKTLEYAECSLMAYMKGFTAWGAEPNDYY